MAYIGTQPLAGQYRKLDDISSGFNGATTSFTTSVGGTNVTAGSPQQLLVSLGGVIQQPTVDYTVNTSTIVFTTAPASGLSFFAVLMGDALNTSVPADGSITSAKLAGSLSVGLAAGSASTPSLFFTGDTNTGIYSPGADQVAISTNGSGRLFVDSSGRVGIGTSSVRSRLDVRQSADSTFSGFTIGASGSDKYIGIGYNSATTSWNIHPTYDSTGGYSPLAFNVGGSEALRIDTSQRVGIGTTAPSFPVDCAQGSALYAYRATSGAKEVKIGANDPEIVSVGAPLYLSAAVGQPLLLRPNSVEAARLDTSGRLLVGTSTALAAGGSLTPAFQIAGGDQNSCTQMIRGAGSLQPSFAFTRSNGSIASPTAVASGDGLGGLLFEGYDGSNPIRAALITAAVDGTPGANDMPGRLVFSTTADGASSPTERMRIKQNGFTKISSTGSYYAESSTYHEIRSASDNSEALFVSHAGTSGTQYGITVYTNNDQNDATRYFLSCNAGGTVRATIRSNGGLANYQANNVNLSDINTKKDISPAADTWDCIKEWEIVNYRYKDQPDDADLNLGVIAQQVAESCPEVITVFQEAKEATEDQPAQEERLGVKEQQMYWMAIKALQEAQVRIETLEAKVAALESA